MESTINYKDKLNEKKTLQKEKNADGRKISQTEKLIAEVQQAGKKNASKNGRKQISVMIDADMYELINEEKGEDETVSSYITSYIKHNKKNIMEYIKKKADATRYLKSLEE